jgi:hypothetical protein
MPRKVEILILALLFALCLVLPTRGAQKAGTPEFDLLTAWNAIVDNVNREDPKLLELNNSLAKYRPGKVILAPDFRAEQKRSRIPLIDSIIADDRERIQELEKLKKAEEASQ